MPGLKEKLKIKSYPREFRGGDSQQSKLKPFFFISATPSIWIKCKKSQKANRFFVENIHFHKVNLLISVVRKKEGKQIGVIKEKEKAINERQDATGRILDGSKDDG